MNWAILDDSNNSFHEFRIPIVHLPTHYTFQYIRLRLDFFVNQEKLISLDQKNHKSLQNLMKVFCWRKNYDYFECSWS